MKMNKSLAIINSICWKRKKNKNIKKHIDFLKTRCNADIIFTENIGHAGEITEKAKNYTTLIAGGGDGTIGEIINKMDHEKQMLAILPLGTGNTLWNDLNLQKNISSSLQKIDLIECIFKRNGLLQKKYAHSTTGFGFISEAAKFANRFLKPMENFCYPLAGTCKSFGQKAFTAKIQTPYLSAKSIYFTSFIVNNTSYIGNIRVFPGADLSDGKMNILYGKTNTCSQLVTNISMFMNLHFYNPGKRTEETQINLILKGPQHLMIDGEIVDSVEEVTYKILPGRLKIWGCPKDTKLMKVLTSST
ncbi:MAG: diacylglycerol kinase family protein [Candidatus Omnitrophota bacterium]